LELGGSATLTLEISVPPGGQPLNRNIDVVLKLSENRFASFVLPVRTYPPIMLADAFRNAADAPAGSPLDAGRIKFPVELGDDFHHAFELWAVAENREELTEHTWRIDHIYPDSWSVKQGGQEHVQ